MQKRVAGAIAALVVTGVAGDAWADDKALMGLSSEIPITVQDAAAIEKGSVDLKLRGTFDRLKQDGGRNRLNLDPEIEVGVANGLSLKANPTYRVGNADDTRQGGVNLSAEINLLAPKDGRLGISLEPLIDIPYGSGGTATEVGIVGRVTQPLGTSTRAPRLHVNLGWRRLIDPESDQRENRFLMVAGVNFAVAPNTAVAFDILRDQQQERGKADNLVEVGVRHVIGDDLALGAGVGVGFGPDSPRYRVLVGVQRSF
ncbi:hypothetical protein [Azospirillum rugosum]|uniref:MetA-pathway of phenol degradation n=1 Tax=Azospirillum rugosum TaxID=416170 RepID=A0ABS4SGW6_9PROT|nr:hypothetical protein [Azospirillum rugosum]MBP2291808.1 hypothetical protein [Azospirillum rugosum]MDQ0524380.1 hypothetical protein [Azospirillum rugosum]